MSDIQVPQNLNCIYPGYLPPTSGAGSLPTEILQNIFCLVFNLHIFTKAWPARDDKSMKYLSFFPYCIAYVCSAWNKACLGIPEFRTYVFVDIGRRSSSALQLSGELEASGSHKINVYISRRYEFTTDPLEYHRMDAFMKVLAGHVSRCQTIRVWTIYQSSLSPLWKYFSGDAPVLIGLHTSSWTNNRQNIPFRGENIISHLRSSQSTEMTLDAYILRHIIPRRWILSSHIDSIRSLAVLDIAHPNSGQGVELPLLDTFCALESLFKCRLNHLSLTRIQFNSEEVQDVMTHAKKFRFEHWLQPNHLVLENLAPSATAAILCLLGDNESVIEYLDIKNCPISDVNPSRVPQIECLTLTDEALTEDLGPILQGSNARTLAIRDCLSFTSLTMNRMSFGSNTANWRCPELTTLSISEKDASDRVSVASIKTLVASRLAAFETQMTKVNSDSFDRSGDARNIARIAYIELEGLGFKNMDDVDYDWLVDNVMNVRIEYLG